MNKHRYSVPLHDQAGREVARFVFDPKDKGYLRRLYEVCDILENSGVSLEAEKVTAPNEWAEMREKATATMYSAVDKLLNYPGAAKEIFATIHPFSEMGGMWACERFIAEICEYLKNHAKRGVRL